MTKSVGRWINTDNVIDKMMLICQNMVTGFLISNAVCDYTIEFNFNEPNVLECKDKMSNWKKYEARFTKTKNEALEELGIKSNDDYDVEIVRVDLDEVCCYNPHDIPDHVSLRFKSSELFVVKVDIEELDAYFF